MQHLMLGNELEEVTNETMAVGSPIHSHNIIKVEIYTQR